MHKESGSALSFQRTEVTTVTHVADYPPGSRFPFKIEITGSSDRPEWFISLVDYDGGTGAVGRFSSENEVLTYAEAFVALAVPLYDAKHGKYGPAPEVSLVGGVLTVEIPPPYGSEPDETAGPAPAGL